MILTSQPEPKCAQWEPASPLTDPGWDDLVMTHPGYSFFHGAAWARVLRDTYHVEPFYRIQRGEFHLRELLPVMEVRSAWFGRRGVSLPFTDECGLLRSDAADPGDAFEEIRRIGTDRGWRRWQASGDWGLAPASVLYLGHHLPLDPEPERSFMRFEPAVRRAIRKAEREGLTARAETSMEAMREFFRLHCDTRRKHGLPPQPVKFFENIHRSIIDRSGGIVVLARFGTQAVAAAVFFFLGTRAVFKFGASASEFLALRGNNLVMWEAIRWLTHHGIERLDFGRTSLNHQGLRRYKSGFGATEREIPACRFDFRAQKFIPCHDRANGWHNYVFRRMPLPVLRLAGRMLYRHFA